MVTIRLGRLFRLRRRAGFLVGRPWRGKERLPVAVDGLPADTDNSHHDWKIPSNTADDVLRLLHRDRITTTGGSGPILTQSTGSMESTRARAVPSESNAGYLVTDREIHYGTVRRRSESAAGYVTASFGPYDAEDFAPRGGLQ